MKFVKILFLYLLIILTLSCGSHLPRDKYPNPALYDYHRMEFDIIQNGKIRKEIGIGNIHVTQDKDISDIYFKIYGLFQGTLYMKSDACGINFSTRFRGITLFKLSDIVHDLNKCSIKITAETDKLNNRQHNIVETGIIKLNVIPKKDLPVTLEYTRTNSTISLYQTYTYVGQGSLQRQEGDLTFFEKFKVDTDLSSGGYFRIAGCGLSYAGSFNTSSFKVSLKDIYNKDILKRSDSCDFEVIIIPNEVINTYQGRFSVNIYGKEVVKLEPLTWYTKRKKLFGKTKLYVTGGEHIVASSINTSIYLRNKISSRYYSNQVYWIRSITTNARKSVYALQNGVIIWRE